MRKFSLNLLIIVTVVIFTAQAEPSSALAKGKKRIIVLRPTYSLLFADFVTPGENIEIGFEQNRLSFGVSVELNEATRKSEYGGGINREETFIIGASLQCGYNDIFRSEWFKVSPKLSFGAWTYSKTSTIETDDGHFLDNNGEDHHNYYVAPMICADIGYRHLFLYVDNSLLIGTGVAYRLNTGISIKI